MSNPLALPGIDIVARGRFEADALELRADSGAEADATMVGYFSTFNDWYRIDSFFEGTFIERLAPGSFGKTIRENRSAMVVNFDHGMDRQIGDKPLGPIEVLREDKQGPYYEVPLLDTDYNRDFVLPALQGRTIDGRKLGSTLGASFRMRVIQESWNEEPGKSSHNPDGIPERTITEARVFEFGPVTYPANPSASAGVRSLTDHLIERSAIRSGRPSPIPPAAPGTGDPTAEPREHSTTSTTTTAALLRIELLRLAS